MRCIAAQYFADVVGVGLGHQERLALAVGRGDGQHEAGGVHGALDAPLLHLRHVAKLRPAGDRTDNGVVGGWAHGFQGVQRYIHQYMKTHRFAHPVATFGLRV